MWRDGAWTMAPDHRGETWYDADGSAVLIDTVGDPAERGLSPDAPPPPPPSADPEDYPLHPYQFDAMLVILSDQKGFDVEAAIDAAINAIPDLQARALAKGKRRNPPGGQFERGDPLFAQLVPAVHAIALSEGADGFTASDVDTAWMTAKDLA